MDLRARQQQIIRINRPNIGINLVMPWTGRNGVFMTFFSKALVILSLTTIPNFILAQEETGHPDVSVNASGSGAKKCVWFCKKEEAPKEAPKESPVLNGILNSPLPESLEAEKKAALTQLAYEMTSRLREIDIQLKNHADLSSEELNSLNESAYKLLADTQVKLGINPKVQLREKFLAAITFADGVGVFSQLSEVQRDIVIETIQNFRGGLYMDLIRLWKRVALVYAKALYVTYERSGHFLADDRAQIVRILTMATVIPMPVMDRSGKTIMVFEHEVAQPDFVRGFNRAIQIFIIESAKLEMNDQQFNQQKDSTIRAIVLSNNTNTRLGSSMNSSTFEICINNTRHLHHTGYSDSVQSQAKLKCFNQYFNHFDSMDSCVDNAKHLHNSGYSDSEQHQAKKRCFDRFNK